MIKECGLKAREREKNKEKHVNGAMFLTSPTSHPQTHPPEDHHDEDLPWDPLSPPQHNQEQDLCRKLNTHQEGKHGNNRLEGYTTHHSLPLHQSPLQDNRSWILHWDKGVDNNPRSRNGNGSNVLLIPLILRILHHHPCPGSPNSLM
jgi:hypothetical protein